GRAVARRVSRATRGGGVGGPPGGGTSLHDVLAQQMAPPVFPVTFDDLASRIETRELHAGERFRLGSLDVSVARLNHPGGVLAYRLEARGHALVYAPDNEHRSALGPTLSHLAQGAAGCAAHAQDAPAGYRGAGCPARVGWGHSTYESAVTVARAAAVKQLVLFHHDPKRSDAAVEAIETRARAIFPDTLAARE